MKNLQHALESILDNDFDITEKDLCVLDVYLKKYRAPDGQLKATAKLSDLIRICNAVGEEVPNCGPKDIKEIISARDALLIIWKHPKKDLVSRFEMYWPASGTQFGAYRYIERNGAQWARPAYYNVKDTKWDDSFNWQFPKRECLFYRLDRSQYGKILDILGKGTAPV